MSVRIDAHQHFWRYRASDYPWIDERMGTLQRDYLPADLRPQLDAIGFDTSIAVQARHAEEETEWLLALSDEHPWIAGVVGWVDLSAPDARDRIARLARHPKLVGLRHIVQDEPDDRYLLGEAFCRGVSELGAFGLTYDVLIFARHLPVAIEFVARFPDQPFVLDHLAKPDIRRGAIDTWARDIRRLAQFPNVCAKISGLVTEADWSNWSADDLRRYIAVAYDCFGPDRLMIGSDWPVCLLAADYARAMSVAIDFLAGQPGDAVAAVFGGTAGRMYGGRLGA